MKIIISIFYILILFQPALADNICIDDLCINYEGDRSKDIDTVDITSNGKTLTLRYKNHWLNAPVTFNITEFTKKNVKVMATYLGNSISGKIIILDHSNSNVIIKKIKTFTISKHSSGEICTNNFIKTGNTITLGEIAEADKRCEELNAQDSLMDINELVFLMEKHSTKNIIDIAGINVYLIQKELKNSNLVTYNNIAYYLQKSGNHEEAVYLLTKILEKFPNRTVAHLNLADSLKTFKKNKQALKHYEIYLDMMKKNKKLSRVPKRVIDFISESKNIELEKESWEPVKIQSLKEPTPQTKITNSPKDIEVIKAEKAEPIKTVKGSTSVALLASLFGLLSLRLKNI